MTLSVGGLGIVSARAPWAVVEPAQDSFQARLELRSMVLAAVCFIGVFVVAYLSNPGETSFRAYLTEQSFRQHLSRLDDGTDEATHDRDDSFAVSNDARPAPPVHFANRASVSLRTPKHVLHNCGILTIGAVVPEEPRVHGRMSNLDKASPAGLERAVPPNVGDSWYVGAFGRWWRGGVLDAWWLDSVSKGMDNEESWTSGILGITLDRRDGGHVGSTPPRTRDRAVPTPATVRNHSPPPPLPKSASLLPLHAAPGERRNERPPKIVNPSPGANPNKQQAQQVSASIPAPAPSPAPPAFDLASSPMIAELLRQVSSAKAASIEVRAQVADAECAAVGSADALRRELEAHRERKRGEDGARAELRTLTKTLEDAKRGAEAGRRDAEKRLRAARSQRDGASARVARLDREIAALRARIADDRAQEAQGAADAGAEERALGGQLDAKRAEIRVAEDVIAALNVRARELEETLAAEHARLRALRERAEMQRQDASFFPVLADAPAAGWTADPALGLPHLEITADPAPLSRTPSGESSPVGSTRPRRLSLGALSNFDHADAAAAAAVGTNMVPKFSPFDQPGHTDTLLAPPTMLDGQISPMSTSLIPSGLIQSISLETPNSKAGIAHDRFAPSEDDPILDMAKSSSRRGSTQLTSLRLDSPRMATADWTTEQHAPLMQSPVLTLHNAFDYFQDEADDDPFRVRPRPQLRARHMSHDRMESQRATIPAPAPAPAPVAFGRRSLDSQPDAFALPISEDGVLAMNSTGGRASPRRWFSTKDKSKKGLNPDAKVFSISKFRTALGPQPAAAGAGALPLAGPAYDMLNPSSLSLGSVPAPSLADSLLSSISMRAFAPSAAEREVLTRALNGSTNASLERLPSLAQVGSLPPSPTHAHAPLPPPLPTHAGAMANRTWLQSLPLFNMHRRPRFSPWGDEDAREPQQGEAAGM